MSFDFSEDDKLKYHKFLKFIYDNDNIKLNIDFDNKITEPDVLLEQILKISRENKLIIHRYKLLNSLLLMCLVDNYFQKYNINNNNNMIKIKKNLLDAYSFCETYKIFPGLSKHLLTEYNLNRNNQIYETISFNDKIKSLI